MRANNAKATAPKLYAKSKGRPAGADGHQRLITNQTGLVRAGRIAV